MCKIRYIHRIEGIVKADRVVKLDNKEFDIVDKPYYILRDGDMRSSVFLFHYLDVTELIGTIEDNHFKLSYGTETGRISSLIVTALEKDQVKLELWIHFRKKISEYEGGEVRTKLLESFDMVKKLYFEKYNVVEDYFQEKEPTEFIK